MKRLKVFLIALFGLVGFGATMIASSTISSVSAEEEVVSTCTVIIPETKNGKIIANKSEGEVGEIVTLTVDPDMFYLTNSVKVNGTPLIESETTKGEYTFALAEGENTISVEFIINEELLGRFTDIVVEASNNDWKNLFSLKNLITIVTWLCDTGLLIVVIRYYIKDKRVANAIEETVDKVLTGKLPDMAANSVQLAMEKTVIPYFKAIDASNEETRKAMASFSKCWALFMEDTPEARCAILQELSSLNVSDNSSLEATKLYIEKMTKESQAQYEEVMKRLNQISASSKEIAGIKSGKELEKETLEPVKVESKESEKEHVDYDGTSI